MNKDFKRLRWLFAAVVVMSAEGAIAGNGVPVAALPVVAQGEARAPIAWLDFCRRYPADCTVDVSQAERIALTGQAWKTIQAVNSRVNTTITPITDLEHWGVVDSWDYPDDGKGDCEDYALLKRKRLVEAGFSRRALLMTVVIDDEEAGHAVLMVRTDHGDLILDNKTGAIRQWHETPYVFVKRESQARAGWVSLGGVGSAVATAAANQN